MSDISIPDQVAAKLLGLRGYYDDRVKQIRVHYGVLGHYRIVATKAEVDKLLYFSEPWGHYSDISR